VASWIGTSTATSAAAGRTVERQMAASARLGRILGFVIFVSRWWMYLRLGTAGL
jgi:hypothetical protein